MFSAILSLAKDVIVEKAAEKVAQAAINNPVKTIGAVALGGAIALAIPASREFLGESLIKVLDSDIK